MSHSWEEEIDVAGSRDRRRSAHLGTSKHKEEDEFSWCPDQVEL